MRQNVHPCEMIQKAAVNYPERIAVLQANGEQITYRELLNMVSSVGTGLYEKHKVYGKPVIVLCDRSIWTYIILLAVTWAGGFYCPIDGKIPQARLDAITQILDNPIVIKGSRESVYGLIPQSNILKPWERKINQDLLYVMFTSGSTGIPKGVAVKIEAVLEMTETFADIVDFPNPLILGNQSPFDFDVSTKDIYLSLSYAGTLVIIPATYFAMPGNLMQFLVKNNVNTLIWAVSAVRVIENFKMLEGIDLENVKVLMFSGETMHPKVMRYWQRKLPNCIFVNLYGPTEVTGNCTYYKIDREYEDDEKIPIGKSFRNFEVMLLSPEGDEILECDIEGEICVRGQRVAAGYYNNQEQTDKVFSQLSTIGSLKSIVYHTGDVGKYDNSGNIIYCGRKDHQIKYMGHRVELGEIETIGTSLSEVNICCALFDKKKNRIVLIYESEYNLDKKLSEILSEKLPRFMIPSVLYRINNIPQTDHGKCDRISLQKMLEDIDNANNN